MSVFDKIKAWFKGDSSKQKQSKARQTYGTKASESTSSSYRKALINKKDEEKERRKRQAETTAKLKSGLSMAQSIDAKSGDKDASYTKKQTTNGTQKVVNKIADKTVKNTAKATAPAKTKSAESKSIENLSNINLAKSLQNGKSAENLERIKGLKMNDSKAKAENEQRAYEQNPNAYAFTKGVASGASFGLINPVAKRFENDEQKKLDERASKEHAMAETAGELVGSLIGFGGTAKATEKVGESLTKKSAQGAVDRLAKSKIIQSSAKSSGKSATELATKIVRGLQHDLGINVTTGNVMSIMEAAETEGDFGDKAREYLKQQGVNVLLGSAMEVAPSAIKGAKNLFKKSNADNEASKILGKAKKFWDEVDVKDIPDSVKAKPTSELRMTSKFEAKELQRRMMSGETDAIRKEAESKIAKYNANVDKRTISKAKKMVSKQQEEIDNRIAPIKKYLKDNNLEETDENVAKAIDELYGEKAVVDNAEIKANENAISSNEKIEPPALEENQIAEESKIKPQVIEEQPVDMPTVKELPKNEKADISEMIPEDSKSYSQIDETPFGIDSNVEKQIELEDVVTKKVEELYPKTNPEDFVPEGINTINKSLEKIDGNAYEIKEPMKFDELWETMKAYEDGQSTARHGDEILSRAGASQIQATTSDEQREIIKNAINESNLSYRKRANKPSFDEALKDLTGDNAEYWYKKIVECGNDFENVKASEAVDLMYRAWTAKVIAGKNLEKEGMQELYNSASVLIKNLSSESGQINQLQGVMVHCDGKTKVRSAVDDVIKLLDESRGFRRKGFKTITGEELSENVYKRRKQLFDLISEDEDVKKALNSIFDSTTDAEYGEAYTELIGAVNRLDNYNWFDYLQEWRYLSMLGNPKTHIRNLVGNTLFSGVREVSNSIGSILEKTVFKDKIDYRSKAGIDAKALADAFGKNPTTQEGKDALEAWLEYDSKRMKNSKFENRVLNISNGNFVTKGLNKASNWNANALDFEDSIFMQTTFRKEYIKLAKANAKKAGEKDFKENIARLAAREAEISTFKEYNAAASVLQKWTKELNNANATRAQMARGFLANAVMPFAKTPANILKQSINYSPAGIWKGYLSLKEFAKYDDPEIMFRAIDEFASGLTGTGIVGLGLLLGSVTDSFTTNAGSEDAAAKFKKQQGVQNYSVQVNGRSYTLDWLSPTITSFFSGVELANQFKNGKSGDMLDVIGNFGQIMSRVVEPVFETSMLSGIYNAIETSRNSYDENDDKSLFVSILAREIAQSYMNSLVPTLQGQIAKSAYKADMMIPSGSDKDYFINSMKVKMGLADTNAFGQSALGLNTDAWGHVTGERSVGKTVANLLSPANIKKVDLTEDDYERIKEYEDYVKAGGDPEDKEYLFPKKQSKTNFSYGKGDKTQVEMSNKDVSTYNQAKATAGEECAEAVLESIIFNRYDKDSSGKRTVLRSGFTKDEKKELVNQFKGKSARDVANWLYNTDEYKNASEAEKETAMNLILSYSQSGKSKGSKLAGERAVIKSQGKDVSEYDFKNELSKKQQEALLPFIKSGTLTYEDAVDFSRNAGKTYYYENDGGGSNTTYYNKKTMIEEIVRKGYSYEQAEALYNAFKQSNAKPYSGNSYSSGSGSGRRYRRSGGGSSSKGTTNKTAGKVTGLKSASTLSTGKSSSSSKSTESKYQLERVKATPPNPKY